MGAIQSKRYKICWQCNGKDAALECSQCTRLFHRDCLTRGELFSKRNWVCVICTKLVENADKEKDLKILPTLITRVMNDTLFKEMLDDLKNALDENDDDEAKFNAIDSILKAIELSKCNDIYNIYNSFDGFLVDIQWILSNFSKIFEGNVEKKERAKLLQQFVSDEIDGLKKCGECYSNANYYPNNWFTMVCDEPHILAWVKFQGCNYWPVKVMAVNGRILSVRFFGDHTHAEVSASKCFLYSTECPGKAARSRGNRFKMAINEANLYIHNIRQAFGSFNYARVNTEFDSMLMSKYISDMIPRSGQPKRRSSESCQIERSMSNRSRTKSLPQLNDSAFENPSNNSPDVQSPIDLTSSEDNADCSESTTDTTTIETNCVLPLKKVRFMDELQTEVKPLQSIDNGGNVQANGSGDTTHSANVIKNYSSCSEVNNTIENSSESANDLDVANATMKQELRKLTEQNAKLADKLNERDHEIYQLKIEKKLLITEIKRLEQRNSKTIEETQTMQICSGCGDSKPRDTFFFCDIQCQKNYWEQLGN